jgi:penicillin amidase
MNRLILSKLTQRGKIGYDHGMKKTLDLSSPFGRVDIRRNEQGIPEIQAETMPALFFGQGYIHVRDRQIQTMLLKAIFTGRLSELLKADEESLSVDTYMRKYGFSRDAEREWEKLSDSCRENLSAYVAGINAWFAERKPVWELRLAGWRHEEWRWTDTLAIARGFGFIGLGDGQASLEKWLMELLRNGTDLAALRELFPSICDPDFSDLYRKVIDFSPSMPEGIRWLKKVPVFRASNNWVVGPGRSASGHAIMAGDPHLEIDRIPAIWREAILTCGDTTFIGVDLPGVPGGIIGRTRDLSWSPTYSYIDAVDFRVEECRGGKYRRSEGWKEFTRRTEEIAVKGKNPVQRVFHENENGILLGDPLHDGLHLMENYAGLRGCGASDLEGILGLLGAKSVREGMECFRKVQAASFSWLLADARGNIGYQMSGRHFLRPEGTSGLLPLPAWEDRYAYKGFVEGARLPQAYNPPEGYLVSANDDRNRYGTSRPCAAHMGTYRLDRISAMLEGRAAWTARDMGGIQTDLYSLQAEAFLKKFGTLIPDSPGGRILKEWDRRYCGDSKGAVVFERFYLSLMRNTFGKRAWGKEPMDFILEKTGIHVAYYHYFDKVLLGDGGLWFSKKDIDQAAGEAFHEACVEPFPPLSKTRTFRMGHLLFSGIFPPFLGFNGGPAFFPGSRATVCQGQFFHAGNRSITFCPSYRFLSDMGSSDVFTRLPGGATDRRFGRYYRNELPRYLKGEYKVLKMRP